MRRLLLVPLVLGLGVACGGGGGGSADDEAGGDATEPAGLAVEAKDYAFEPAELTTAAGEVKVTMENTGAVEHDVTIDSPKLQITALAGQTKSGTVTLESGTYDFYCAVAGHRAQGMEGKLTVQ